MKYRVYGPFKLPRNNRGIFTRDAGLRTQFWREVDEVKAGLSGGVGCYVISVRNVVWYVGIAESQSFKRECFAPHTVNKIDEAISEGSGNAVLHLVAKFTPTNRLSHPSPNGHRDAGMLETLFIGIGLQRNPKLLNKSETAILREIVVPGFYNSPQGAGRAASVQSLKQAMGID